MDGVCRCEEEISCATHEDCSDLGEGYWCCDGTCSASEKRKNAVTECIDSFDCKSENIDNRECCFNPN